MRGVTATYLSVAKFSLEGDRTAEFRLGQRLFAFCGEHGAKSVQITAITFNGSNTIVVVSGDKITPRLATVAYQREEELVNELVWEGESEPPDYFRGIMWLDTTLVTTTTTTTAEPTTSSSTTTTTTTTTTTSTTVPEPVLLIEFEDFPFTDTSGNSHNIVNTSVTRSSTEAMFGTYSGYFDGTARLDVDDSDDFYFGDNDFTIRGYIFPTNLAAGTQVIFSQGLSYNEIFNIFFNSNGSMQAGLEKPSGTYPISMSSAPGKVIQDQWNEIVFVRSGTDWLLYCNDELIASDSTSYTFPNISAPWELGAEFGGAFDYYGYMDRFEIYNGQALPPI
jgi:hypothetical protein